jgi:hypothetical protein
MTPEQKRRIELRRVISTAGEFARNLAYRQAMWDWRFLGLFFRTEKPLKLNYWIVSNISFLQIAILEWAKLFGGKSEKHHWKRILSDPDGFESSLLTVLSKGKEEYEADCKTLLRYRDKVVAHLDPENWIIQVPQMEVAKASVWHLVKYLFEHEIKGDEVANLTESFEAFDSEFEKRLEEVRAIFWSALGYPYPLPPNDLGEFLRSVAANPSVSTEKSES